MSNLPEGYGFVAGLDRKTARAALDAAEKAGLDPSVVVVGDGGFIMPDEAVAAYQESGDSEEEDGENVSDQNQDQSQGDNSQSQDQSQGQAQDAAAPAESSTFDSGQADQETQPIEEQGAVVEQAPPDEPVGEVPAESDTDAPAEANAEPAVVDDDGEAEAEAAENSPTPDRTWKNAEIRQYASDNGIDLGDATTKADMLSAIDSAATKEE